MRATAPALLVSTPTRRGQLVPGRSRPAQEICRRRIGEGPDGGRRRVIPTHRTYRMPFVFAAAASLANGAAGDAFVEAVREPEGRLAGGLLLRRGLLRRERRSRGGPVACPADGTMVFAMASGVMRVFNRMTTRAGGQDRRL